MVSTLESYRILSTDLTRTLSRTASEPQIARETEYYRANIGNVKSVDDLLKNDRLYRYTLKAFGLDDLSYARAFIKKVLNEGIDNRNAFANKLSDPRYRDLATTFNFARNGEATTSTDDVKQKTVDRYVQLALEQNAGAQNEGVRLALYFARKAPELSSTLGILADKALLQVAQTALRIPAATSAIDIDKQVEIYAKRVNVEDFKDPKKLEAFISRFTTLYELDNRSAANTASSPASILVGGQASFGISASTLASIQSLKLGGR